MPFKTNQRKRRLTTSPANLFPIVGILLGFVLAQVGYRETVQFRRGEDLGLPESELKFVPPMRLVQWCGIDIVHEIAGWRGGDGRQEYISSTWRRRFSIAFGTLGGLLGAITSLFIMHEKLRSDFERSLDATRDEST